MGVNKTTKNIGMYIILIVLAVTLVNVFLAPAMNHNNVTSEIIYSELIDSVKKNKVERVKVDKDTVRGTYTDGKHFKVEILNPGKLLEILTANNVQVEVVPPKKPSIARELMIQLFPMLILLGLWIFFMYNMQGGGNKMMGFGKSKAKVFLDNRPKVTFDDVAGCEEAKEDLAEVVEFLKTPGKYKKLGAKIPKGVLLFGEPGTGKTLLARAVAGEADVAFFSISGSDFVEMFVGVGASRVRDLFEQARKQQPCIIFIDEIDAVGRQRGTGLGGGHDEREQTLNQLLVEMDGFDNEAGVIVIAATNRPDVLDPALLRPGRFDRQVVVDKPDLPGRRDILKVHLRGIKYAEDIDLDVIARRTSGFAGADLANVVNEAALLAARRNREFIEMSEFEEAIARVVAGPERKSRIISSREKSIIAYHEVGHALVAHKLADTDPVHKISIIPRGRMALGYTLQMPAEDRFLQSKNELLNRIAVLLGGRTAELLKFEDVTTGASNDLERATQLAKAMVTRFGMSDTLGLVTLGKQQQEVFLGRDLVDSKDYSEKIAYEVDKEIKNIIDVAFEKAKKILLENSDQMELIATTLLEKEVLEGDLLAELLGDNEFHSANTVKYDDIKTEPTTESGQVEKTEEELA